MDEDYYSYIKMFFGRLAPFYDAIDLLIFRIRDKVVEFTNAENGSRVLDVAAGTGKQSFAFAKNGCEVLGIDISEEMLEVARRKNRYRNVRFEVADGTKLPFKDKDFDVCCISFALHDMPLSVRKKILEEMVRVTKLKGTVVIVDYGLPRSRIGRYLIYRFVKFYESKYYPDFMKFDIKSLLNELGVVIEGERSVLFGVGRILKGRRINNDGQKPIQ